jgi:hypothetical protein
LSSVNNSIGTQPPQLVQRCNNGTTAELCYLEVNVICPCKSPHWTVDNVRTADTHWGEWHKSSADFNPNHNHDNAAPKQASLQTTSRPHHHATPKKSTVCKIYSSHYKSVKKKKSKKVALATKYLVFSK